MQDLPGAREGAQTRLAVKISKNLSKLREEYECLCRVNESRRLQCGLVPKAYGFGTFSLPTDDCSTDNQIVSVSDTYSFYLMPLYDITL